ncbi:MAG: hypothetical protein ACR2K4_00305 [Candidatus Limnocylindria bacterium]
MRSSTLPMAVVLAALLGLLIAAPSSAATTGTLCGQVTAFTAPTAVVDGSITIDGTVEAIDSSAFGAVDAATLTVLTVLAAANATTCLTVTANVDGDIVDLAIAAQAEICGAVTLDTATDVYSVADVALPLGLVSADADLQALLGAAATAGASVCVDVTIDATTGLITTVNLNATLELCGDVALDADSTTIAGVDVPLTLLDAEAEAVLALAVAADVNACITVTVDDTSLVQANLFASIDLCGGVTVDASGNATIDGVTIDATLLDADATALLALTATADGTACAAVDASSTGGNTSVGVTVTIEVCAEVTAVTDDTVTLGDVTFIFAGAAAAGVEVGDVICVAATTSPTGDPIITDIDTTDADDGAAPGAGGGGGRTLPDTATSAPRSDATLLLASLLIAVAIGVLALRRGQAEAP